jgi:predicted AAA+ superfamily ATPase
MLELGPFGASELPPAAFDRLWLCGGYPDGGVLKPAAFGPWQQAYLQALTQRDLPAWGLPAKPGVALRLLRMLAACQGAVWNASQIGAGLGINYGTVNAYTDFMEGAFLVRRLQPWHANLAKRLVKSPKVYVRDSGLLHNLLGLDRGSKLWDMPWVGASWEGFVIEQVLGTLRALGIQAEPHYFRTSDGHELDLLLETPRGLHAIEIKLTAHPLPEDLARARKAAAMVKAKSLTLICRKDLGKPDGSSEQVLTLPSAITRLRKLL